MRIICLPYGQIFFLLTPYPTPSYPDLLNICIHLRVLVDLTYSISSLAPYPDIYFFPSVSVPLLVASTSTVLQGGRAGLCLLPCWMQTTCILTWIIALYEDTVSIIPTHA